VGLKRWLLKKTGTPAGFANAYASGAIGLIEHLAASVVVFSGRRPIAGTPKAARIAFDTFFELEQSGFDPVCKDVASLVAPNVSLAHNIAADLFERTFRVGTAFVFLHSENSAHRYMKRENASQFSKALLRILAERSVGRFGFDKEPSQVGSLISEILPIFCHDKALNTRHFGRDDAFGCLLSKVSPSEDNAVQYGFVAGSLGQPLGCGTAVAEVVTTIEDSIKRCTGDTGW
jgi:hypothetical protein